MHDALQAIIDYVQAPQTDHAMLITGPWGCGKTYFWKNEVEPALRKMRSCNAGYKPLYASLYGCQSTKNIDTELFLASHPQLKREWARRLGGVVLNQVSKAFTGFELPAIDLRWFIDTKSAVLCFDDLERTPLPMKEALGYINTFVEHERAKVIILCNEEPISGESRETYHAMKEKVVGVSLAFHPDLDRVFRALIDDNRQQPPFHQFLVKNAELLRRLFDRSETQNIRSLRRALNALGVIFKAMAQSKIDPNAVARQMIYAVGPASFELHGRGADPADLGRALAREHIATPGLTTSLKATYEGQFAERYFTEAGLAEWRDAVGCPPICEFLVTGVLDRPALTAWGKKLTVPPDESEERIKQLEFGFRDMEDEEFDRTVNEVLDEIMSGKITAPGRYVGLYDMFESFADEGLIPMTRQEVLEAFDGGLAKAQASGAIQGDPSLTDTLDHTAFAPRTDEGKTLRQHVVEASNGAVERLLREQVLAHTARLRDDPESFMCALFDGGQTGLLSTPVFQELAADDLAVSIVGFPNTLKKLFARALRERYTNRPPYAALVVELDALTQARDALNKHVEQANRAPIPMSLYLVQDIVRTLDGAIERLRLIEPRNGAKVPASPEHAPGMENGGVNADSP